MTGFAKRFLSDSANKDSKNRGGKQSKGPKKARKSDTQLKHKVYSHTGGSQGRSGLRYTQNPAKKTKRKHGR